MLELTTLIFAVLAASFGALAYSQRTWAAKQSEMIAVLRAELKDWQNKALVRHGSSILGSETAIREPKADRDIVTTPRVVMRSQMAARAEQIAPTIHANNVGYPRVSPELIEKVAEILG